jgi:hypothetical protein
LHAAFDYDAEVAMARDALAPFLASLRVAMPEAGPAEPLARLRVLGARVVHEADQDADLCPFGESRRGVTLTVAGELPVTALELDQASLETAIDADGNDLTPADEWDRRVHFPKLTKDGRTAYLDIHLAPPPGVRGLQLLQGRLRCLHSCGSETVDLGFDRLGPEATGTVHGARILRLEHDDGGQAVLEVQLQVARGRVLGAVLRLPDGELPLTPAGYSSCNDECSLTYHIDGEVPPDARLEFSFATELTYSDFAFRLEQIDWLGQPL